MNITHIRNATQIIDYAGKKFLIDPMLADKGAWPGFPGTARSELRNPLVALPFSRDNIIDVDAVIVTHTHDDHCRYSSSTRPTVRCCAARGSRISAC